MNLFLVQKINPFKLNLAKFFAVFLVCFSVGGVANNTFSHISPTVSGQSSLDRLKEQLPSNPTARTDTYTNVQSVFSAFPLATAGTVTSYTVKDYDTNKVYQVNIASTKNVNTGVPLTEWAYVYEIDPSTNTRIESSVKNELPAPGASKDVKHFTDLPISPIGLNNAPIEGTGTLTYDYTDGRYVFTNPTTGEKIRINPPDVLAKVEELKKSLSPEDSTKLDNAVKYSDLNKDYSNQTAANNVSKSGTPTQAPKPTMDCGVTEIKCLLAKAIYYLTIVPAGLLLAMSGWFLNIVFVKTVVELSQTLGTNNGNPSASSFYYIIKQVWGIFRDLINMSFIFILLYASIVTILKADTARLKQAISNIIIAALLINFSLFFTQIIIDVSNNFAVTIYNTINQGSNTGKNNIADAFMQRLSLHTLLEAGAPTGNGKNDSYLTGIISISIFGSILILVLAVTFFVMAVLFVVRFVEFMILMMMSPIGIGSYALPKLNQAFTDKGFWSNLLNQCFFAPIMLFFLWITIRMLEGITSMTNPVAGPSSGGLAGMLTDGKQAAAGIGIYLLAFTVTIFLLIKGMGFAKSMSSAGAKSVQAGFLKYSGADWVQNRLQKAPRAVGTRAFNATAGRSLNTLASSRVGQALGSTRLGNSLYNKINQGGAGYKAKVDERAKQEIARAELRTAAATRTQTRDIANQQQILADANILRAEERIRDREVANNGVTAAETNLRDSSNAASVAAGTAVIDLQTNNPIQLRDIAHAQEVRTQINEDLQTTDRDISNFDQQIKRINDAITASGGMATIQQRRDIQDLETQKNTRLGERESQRRNLENINRLVRPLQNATRELDRIDTELSSLHPGYNKNAVGTSTEAINRLATEVRRNGHESVRNISTAPGSVAVAIPGGPDVKPNETQAQYRARTASRETQRLQTEIQNTQLEHTRQNATGRITGGILPGFGLNQAGREAAAREYRQRYTRSGGANR